MNKIIQYEEFEQFYKCCSKSKAFKQDALRIYNIATKNENDLNKMINRLIIDKPPSWTIMYMYIVLKFKLNVGYPKTIVNNRIAIIRYFNIATEAQLNKIREKYKGGSYYSCMLRFVLNICVFYSVNNIDELLNIGIEQIEKDIYLKKEEITESGAKAYLSYLEEILTNRIKPYNVRRFTRTCKEIYGTDKEALKMIVIKYYKTIDNQYRGKKSRQNKKMPIRRFFQYLDSKYDNVDEVSKITVDIFNNYKEDTKNYNGIKPSTKNKYIQRVFDFFLWAYDKGYSNIILEVEREKFTRTKREYENMENKKMFKEREHYLKIFSAIVNYKPRNEVEELCRHFLLIGTATGLRRSELYWLGPGCVTDDGSREDGSQGCGEIMVQIKEKTGIANKPTSIYPWGLDSIMYLQKRFERGMKIKFYNEELNKEYYSLFEYKGKILYRTTVYRFFEKIIKEADIRDKNNNIVLYKNVKLHGFRHQKFIDIYNATGGNLSAVQIDSNHSSMAMLRNYTVQNIRKRKIELMKLIDNQEVVGRGAEILASVINTQYDALEYFNIVKIMEISDKILNEKILGLIKDLGFGYCIGSSCSLLNNCEACNYYFACKDNLEALKSRYAKNLILLNNKVNAIGKDKFMQDMIIRKNIESVMFQKKWLKELGETDESINNYIKSIIEQR